MSYNLWQIIRCPLIIKHVLCTKCFKGIISVKCYNVPSSPFHR